MLKKSGGVLEKSLFIVSMAFDTSESTGEPKPVMGADAFAMHALCLAPLLLLAPLRGMKHYIIDAQRMPHVPEA